VPTVGVDGAPSVVVVVVVATAAAVVVVIVEERLDGMTAVTVGWSGGIEMWFETVQKVVSS
jgi:hypothetical protein